MTDQSPRQSLHRVQELDLSLDQLRAEEKNFPEALKAARAEQDRLNNELEETEITLEGVEKRVKQAEFDLTSVRDQIAHAKDEQEKNAFDARAQSQYGSRIQQLEERREEMEEDLAPLHERQRELTEKAAGLREQYRAGRPGLAELETQEKRGMDTGLRAVHPITGDKVPVWVANFVLMGYGTGAVMAVPGHDQRDNEVANKYGLPIKQVIALKDARSESHRIFARDGTVGLDGHRQLVVVENLTFAGRWWKTENAFLAPRPGPRRPFLVNAASSGAGPITSTISPRGACTA